MSWLKKLFGRHDDEEEQLLENFATTTDEPVEKRFEQQKEMDTRIVYQYPKGQFKFPLIPDERESERQRRKARPVVEREEPVEVQRPKAPTPTPIHIQKRPIEKQDYSKRPFRPTEIPSPVFGFEKRTQVQPVQEEIVEFELESFLESEPILQKKTQKNQHQPEERIPFQASNEVAATLEKVVVDTPEEIVYELPEANESFVDLAVEAVGEELKSTEVVVETVEIEHPRTVDVGGTTWAEEAELDPLEVLETLKGADKTVPDTIYETPKQESFVESFETVKKEPLEDSHETIEQETQVESYEMTEQESAVGSPETMKQESQVVSSGTREQVAPVELSEPNDQIEPLAPPPAEEPKRKHLPFNVLMLKEDRRRLQEKQINRIPEVTAVKPTRSNTEPVAVQEHPSVTIEKQPVTSLDSDASNEPFTDEEPYYVFPSLDLLTPPVIYDTSAEWLEERERLLNDTLESFNVRASVVNVTQGPSVTRFEVQPEPGVKVNKITNLSDDIKLSLAAKDIRIEAPIPGKHTIGIEVPNQVSRPVLVSEIINSPEFLHSTSPLTAVLGLDISGHPIVTDLRKMPHGLIAGATGSGKSVCINTILVSLLYKARPDELKLLLIDPKMVELAPYNHIPHLVSPVITDVKAATAALKWAVEEMERRYELFAHTGVREINRFNELCNQHGQHADKLPFIVIIIDELADLMMMAPADVEEAICRIAQKARACGIHLIIATQRPSVDVITGLIKANVPTRIAFSVSSQIDSRTIIDIAGAERLLGKGDMLFLENGSSKPVRLQGTFVSDEEIDEVVAHVRREQQPNYIFEQEELLKKAVVTEEEDELFFEACEFIVDQGSASTSSIQRRFKIGYNRAARLIDMMEKHGFISENRGSKPRDVLIDMDDLHNWQEG